MNAIASRLLLALGAAALIAGFTLYMRSLHADLAEAQQEASTARQGNADRDEAIRELRHYARANDDARTALERQRDRIGAALASRETVMRKLQNENAELRAWAGVAVPDAVIRLHDHPAHTGAADYRERVREGEALHAAGRVDPQ